MQNVKACHGLSYIAMTSFTPEYQIKLLALLCLDREFFSEVISYLEPTHFTLHVSQWLYERIVKHFLDHKQLPTAMVVEQEYANFDAPFLPEEVPLYNVFLNCLREGKVDEVEYLKTSARKFAVSRTVKTILNERSDDIDSGDIDAVISSLKRGTSGLIKSNLGLRDKSVFSINNFVDLYNEGGGIRTGISLIDQWVGGLFKQELTFFLADTNVGKSIVMTYIGGQILRQFKKVLHVTLEMSATRTLLRYCATLAEDSDNIGFNILKAGQPLEQVYDYMSTLYQRYEGNLAIDELPAGKASVEDIGRLVDMREPDILILDYLDLLKPIRKRDAKRHELEELTTAVRELAKEKDIPVLSATQANRTAANRRIVGKEFASEDYNKMRIADVTVGMGQTLDDAIRHEVILFLTKARNDEKDKAERYRIDYQRMAFVLVRQELLRSQEITN